MKILAPGDLFRILGERPALCGSRAYQALGIKNDFATVVYCSSTSFFCFKTVYIQLMFSYTNKLCVDVLKTTEEKALLKSEF